MIVALCLIIAGLAFMYARDVPTRAGGLVLFIGGALLFLAANPGLAILLAILVIAVGVAILFFGAKWVPLVRPRKRLARKGSARRKKRPSPNAAG